MLHEDSKEERGSPGRGFGRSLVRGEGGTTHALCRFRHRLDTRETELSEVLVGSSAVGDASLLSGILNGLNNTG